MDNYPLISVIVPVFNAEQYIKECIESILNQTYSNIECILINDGSLDESEEICKNFTLFDDRVILISQPNKGVSAARNKGIDVARGEWIMFVDSDDWIEITSIEKGLQIAKEYNSEIVGWNLIRGEKNTDIKPYVINRNQEDIKYFVLSTMAPYYDFILNNVQIPLGSIRSSCAKLFKSTLCKDIRFTLNLPIAEDALFCNEMYQKANNIVFFNEYLYNYRVNQKSTVYKYRENIESVNKLIYEKFKQHQPPNLTESENKIYTLAIAYECLSNLMVYKLFHKKSKISFEDKVSETNRNIENYNISSLKNIGNDIYRFFPIQQKIAIYLVLNRWTKILLVYWNLKNRIAHK